MPRTAGIPMLSSVSFYGTETNPSTNVGQLVGSDDGRLFRYVKAGAVALVTGNVIQAPVQDTTFKDMAVQSAVAISVAPAAIGGYPIPVTLGGNSTTSTSQFSGGMLVVSSSAGIGQALTILSNDVATNGTTCNFYVLEQPAIALTTSSKASVVANPFSGVIQLPTAHTGMVVGGAVSAIPITTYGWIQVGGLGAVLSDATVTAAATMALSGSVTTAGAATKAVAADTNIAVSLYTVTVSAEVQPACWLLA